MAQYRYLVLLSIISLSCSFAADPPRSVWDISNGITITATSGIRSGFDASDMFGANNSIAETGDTVFADGLTDGYIHFTEWQTPVPVTLTAFNLRAGGDGAVYNNEREFAQFTLKAKLHPGDQFTTIYTLTTTHPYTFVGSTPLTLISTDIPSIDAQYFRAEFTQWNAGRGFDGPRVVELEGFVGASNPTPAPGDGISDEWRTKYFSSVTDPNGAALADPDNDGANNYQEFIDGTNPLTSDAAITPLFSTAPGAGTYTGSVSVSINNRSPATVRYTLSGLEPTSSSDIYSGPILLSGSATVRARLFVNSSPVSPTISASYTVTEPEHIRESKSDLFDIRQGAQVLVTSPIWQGFFQDAMFGNDSPSLEQGSTIFADGQPNGSIHVIEWKTAQPIELTSFTLFAAGDGTVYNNEREFDQFVLKAKLQDSDNYATIYTYHPTHPYTILDATTDALLLADIPPVAAQFFRAEFTQINMGRGFDGPRIVELDGFGTVLGQSLSDGIPDTWRLKFFGSVSDPNAAAIADPDGDGADNYQEYLDGTNPLLADDHFAPLLTVYPPAGSYPGPLDVQLTARGSSSIIRYTLDGSDPSNAAPTYSGSLRLTQSGTLKAQLFVGTIAVSRIVETAYTLTARPAMIPSTNDLFDIHQGARVLRTSALRLGSNGSEIFGDGGGSEPSTTLFADGYPENFVHFVEWQTALPVVLNSINLYASGDDSVFNYEREFAQFTLKARLRTNESFVTIYTLRPDHPYTFLDASSRAILSDSFAPVEALYFRAEFIQRNNGRGFDGPRVIELDGFGSPVQNSLADGIPDSWRIQYFGSINSPDAAAAADPDNDGATNFQEYLDGTNPLVPDAISLPLLSIAPLSGSYLAPLNVTINSRGPTVIHYTEDGSEPLVNSPVYDSSVTLNASATVRARLFVNSTPVSAIVAETYTLHSLQDLPPSAGPSHTDAFDVRQGAKVLRTSGVRGGFLPDAMFGNDSPSVETGSTVFQDDRDNGFTHFIEFKTASPVQLQRLDLYAAGDGETYLYEREFASFTLRAKSSPDKADFDVVVANFAPSTHPYQFLDRSNLVFTADVSALSQTPLQYFRAEFVQWDAGRGYDAPRIIELDGFGQMTGGINPVIADWTFEEGQIGNTPASIKDYSGNEHTGSPVIGTPSFVGTAPSVAGLVSLSTGTPNNSGFLSGPSSDLNLGEEFTFEALLQPTAQAGTNLETVFVALDENNGQVVYALAYDPEAAVAAFIVLNSSGDAFYLASGFPADGRSHHLAAVLGSQELTLYIDKSLTADTICPIEPGSTPLGMGSIAIGLLPFSDAPGFHGVLDRVRLSNRVLDPSEFFETEKAPAGLLILQPPVSVSAVAGDTVSFSVQASASASLSYEWRFNDQLIAGATSNVLVLPNVRLDQAGTYLVTVRAGADQTSLSARLTVREPDNSQLPIILGQPDSQFVALGSLVQFGVTVNSPTPLSYQWYFNGAPLAGGTNAVLILPSTTLANAGTYTVDVGNVAGVVRSQGAILDIFDPGQSGGEIYLNNRADGVDAPVTDNLGNPLVGTDYLAQLYAGASADTLAPIGGAIPFRTGVAAGYFVDAYSRLVPGIPVGGTAFVQIRAWQASAGTSYEQAQATGGLHGTSAGFSVTLGGGAMPPAQLVGLQSFSLKTGLHITEQPHDASARIGDSVSFSVQVDGTGPFTYQWRLNGVPIPGATGSSLLIDNIQPSHAGEYTVAVSNSLESTVSSPAELRILDSTPPTVTITSSGGNTSSSNYTLAGTVSDDTAVTRVEWAKNGTTVGAIPFDNGHFQVSDLALSAGDNAFRVRTFDVAGNVGTAEITVTLESDQSVVVPPVAPVQEGERFSVPIILTSGGDVSALSFVITYDTNFLGSPEFTWSSPTLAPVQSVDSSSPGVIQALLSLPGQTLSSGDFVLATVEFRPRSVPADLDALLNLKVTGIFSANGDPILSGTAVRSGKVTIVQRTVTGDNNANDQLDVGDASVILRMADNIDPVRSWDVPLNDLNQSKTLDAGDALQVLRAAAHIDPQPAQTAGRLRSQSVRAAAAGAGSSRLSSDKTQLHAGDQITIRLLLDNRTTPLFGSSFKLEYPTTALLLDNSSSHRVGALVPTTAITVWNVAPGQTNYANQNGTLYAAFSNPTAWSGNSGELAIFTFTVLGGATVQNNWSIKASGIELSDGFETQSLSPSEIALNGDIPVPAQLSATSYNPQNGYFSLHLIGVSGARYRVDVSEDLKIWTELSTYTLSNGELFFTDIHSKGRPARYYRAAQL